jgi:hypothetical protein
MWPSYAGTLLPKDRVAVKFWEETVRAMLKGAESLVSLLRSIPAINFGYDTVRDQVASQNLSLGVCR